MKGVYTASLKISGLNSARTLLYITSTSSKIVEILESEITNVSNETNEQCEATWQEVNVLGTPTATTLTPAKEEKGDQASTVVAKGNVTASEPSYVADTEIGRGGFPSITGYRYPNVQADARVFIPPSGTFGLRLLNAPSSFDAIVRVRYREIG